MFKKDFYDFLQTVNESFNEYEIRKKYLFMVKKYHPDTAPSGLEFLYNDYMVLINRVYSKGRTSVKEVDIPKKAIDRTFENQKNGYVFYDYYGRERRYTNYLEYIFHLGMEEYNTALLILSNGTFEDCYINTQQKFNVNDNKRVFDSMQHIYNAIKCFSCILKNYPNYVFIESVKEQFQKVIKLNNNISKIIE